MVLKKPKVIFLSQTGAVPVEKEIKYVLSRYKRFRHGATVYGGYEFQTPRTVARELKNSPYVAVIDGRGEKEDVLRWIWGDNVPKFEKALTLLPDNSGPEEVFQTALAVLDGSELS